MSTTKEVEELNELIIVFKEIKRKCEFQGKQFIEYVENNVDLGI